MSTPAIALVGDYSAEVAAHHCIPLALKYAARATGKEISWSWIGTDTIGPDTPSEALTRCAGVWLVPASPYRRMDGALAAVRFARENGIPFLGTCGGFQHALIEFARSVAGLRDADHGETNPGGRALIITSLGRPRDHEGQIRFSTGSRLRAIYGCDSAAEGYRCSFGLNTFYRNLLEAAGLRFSAFDAEPEGAPRAFELPSHLFFFGALFQPERSALFTENAHPLITAFVRAVVDRAG